MNTAAAERSSVSLTDASARVLSQKSGTVLLVEVLGVQPASHTGRKFHRDRSTWTWMKMSL
jgi:hypothetical protein